MSNTTSVMSNLSNSKMSTSQSVEISTNSPSKTSTQTIEQTSSRISSNFETNSKFSTLESNSKISNFSTQQKSQNLETGNSKYSNPDSRFLNVDTNTNISNVETEIQPKMSNFDESRSKLLSVNPEAFSANSGISEEQVELSQFEELEKALGVVAAGDRFDEEKGYR